MKRRKKAICEADLYPAVKAFLEGQGYEVKGEVRDCDVVARRGEEPPVIVEMKLRFNLALLLQGVERLSLAEEVYLAVPRRAGRRYEGASPEDRLVQKLCRMLGVGLLTVNPEAPPKRAVEVLLDPLPYRPRKSKPRIGQLLGEFQRRRGDPNRGGVRGVKLVTAYRQEALRCVQLLEGAGELSLKALRATGLVPNAGPILQQDVYGWFERRSRGIYGLSEAGRGALDTFAHALDLPVQEADATAAGE